MTPASGKKTQPPAWATLDFVRSPAHDRWSLGVDVYGAYQFWSDDDLKQLTGDDLDSITFSAVLRFGM